MKNEKIYTLAVKAKEIIDANDVWDSTALFGPSGLCGVPDSTHPAEVIAYAIRIKRGVWSFQELATLAVLEASNCWFLDPFVNDEGEEYGGIWRFSMPKTKDAMAAIVKVFHRRWGIEIEA